VASTAQSSPRLELVSVHLVLLLPVVFYMAEPACALVICFFDKLLEAQFRPLLERGCKTAEGKCRCLSFLARLKAAVPNDTL
jgi:hypothetical protein